MNIREFKNPPSQALFWMITGPVCASMVLLTIIIITWGRPRAIAFRKKVRERLKPFAGKRIGDIEGQ